MIKGGTSEPTSADDTGGLGFVLRAAAFAAHKHRFQRRKDADATPYINHPLALADLLCNEVGINDPLILVAALLHDTIEDTETTQAELAQEFGDAVANIVAEVTDDKLLDKPDRKRLQIEHAAHASERACAVKWADKICNLRDVVRSPPASWDLARKQEYFDWAEKVTTALPRSWPQLKARFDEVYRQRPVQ